MPSPSRGATRVPVHDSYYSLSKLTHRYQFAAACKEKREDGDVKDILYTESSDGAATYELLKAGFYERQLHPCNDNSLPLRH